MALGADPRNAPDTNNPVITAARANKVNAMLNFEREKMRINWPHFHVGLHLFRETRWQLVEPVRFSTASDTRPLSPILLQKTESLKIL